MAKDELRLIEEALIQDMLDASPEETIADLREGGMDPSEAEALLDSMAAEAVRAAKDRRLAVAKQRAAAFHAKPPEPSTPAARAALQGRLRTLKSGSSDPGMMLAARKGSGMSERDEESLAEDLAELDRLHSEDGGA
ncbi:MAG: hypothetical protein ACRYGP_01845 [Janthinobacterium lividum]